MKLGRTQLQLRVVWLTVDSPPVGVILCLKASELRLFTKAEQRKHEAQHDGEDVATAVSHDHNIVY